MLSDLQVYSCFPSFHYFFLFRSYLSPSTGVISFTGTFFNFYTSYGVRSNTIWSQNSDFILITRDSHRVIILFLQVRVYFLSSASPLSESAGYLGPHTSPKKKHINIFPYNLLTKSFLGWILYDFRVYGLFFRFENFK